jgi:hypothetical protein
MSEQDELFEPDLIDRIANALPTELRADYYREIRHCRSLPQNDEMLRILRVMQFLVVLIVQVPERMAAERQQLAEILAGALVALQEIRQSAAAHQAQLDQRLAQLPRAIAEGIKPEAIAATINENLRQQFVKSTIPETADALAVAAAQIKEATAEFVREATLLTNSYRGAVVDARKAIASLESTCSDAIHKTQSAAQELVRVFREEYRWSLYALTALGLFVGIGIGIWYEHWLNLPAHP